VLADLVKFALWLIGLLGTREAVKFIQLDVQGLDLGDDLLIGSLGRQTGTLNPTLHGGRMDALNPSDRFWTQPFEPLKERALDFLLRRLEVVEGRAIPIAESFPALPTAQDKDGLAAPQGVTAVIG
jgi:hypothetical protein